MDAIQNDQEEGAWGAAIHTEHRVMVNPELTEFTAPTPWEDVQADCMVITCSDHQFRVQVGEFVAAFGFTHPHVLSFPSGLALAHPMVVGVGMGFLSKAVDKLLQKAQEVIQVSEVLCIAHENCGVYGVGKIALVDTLARRFRGKSVREIQCEHITRSAARLQASLHGARVRTYYADVVESPGGKAVKFNAI